MAEKLTPKNLPAFEPLAPGRTGCDGCGGLLAMRLASKVLGSSTIMANATGCMCGIIGHSGALLFPYIHTLFGNTASMLAGIDMGLKAQGKGEGVTLVGLAGDGGTTDIGLQSLSGAVERGHRFLYICYDNESYMNTGGQRSGGTPLAARTATTPVGSERQGEQRPLTRRKNMVLIMAAHGIPYAATASIAYPLDLVNKVKKASQINGPTYLHILSPCPTGWGFDDDQSVRIAKLAVRTRIAPLFEVEEGIRLTLWGRGRPGLPIGEYLREQRRFRHLYDLDDMEFENRLQEEVDQNWAALERMAEE